MQYNRGSASSGATGTTRMLRPLTSLVLLTTLAGCGAALENLVLVSRAVTRLHLPPRAQVALPFTIAVDADSTCGEYKRFTVSENGFTRTITVDLMFQPPQMNATCIGAFILERYEESITPTAVGTYTVDFMGYDGRHTTKIEVVDQAVPAWEPPPLNHLDTRPNY